MVLLKGTGHQGQDRTLPLLKPKFNCNSVEQDVRHYVRCCTRIVMGKMLEPNGHVAIESIRMTAPLEIVCIDVCMAGIPRSPC